MELGHKYERVALNEKENNTATKTFSCVEAPHFTFCKCAMVYFLGFLSGVTCMFFLFNAEDGPSQNTESELMEYSTISLSTAKPTTQPTFTSTNEIKNVHYENFPTCRPNAPESYPHDFKNLDLSLLKQNPESGYRIPKKIFQTYKSWEALPEEVKGLIERMKNANKGWKYEFSDNDQNESFIKEAFGPDMLATYLKINPEYGAARADFWRYLKLYFEGGVYFDVKSSPGRPLGKVIGKNDSYILAHWDRRTQQKWHAEKGRYPPYGEFEQWHIISEPKHVFLRFVILEVCHRIHHFGEFPENIGQKATLKTTGPYPYNDVIRELLEKRPDIPHTEYVSHEDLGFIYDSVNHLETMKIGSYRDNTSPLVLM